MVQEVGSKSDCEVLDNANEEERCREVSTEICGEAV